MKRLMLPLLPSPDMILDPKTRCWAEQSNKALSLLIKELRENLEKQVGIKDTVADAATQVLTGTDTIDQSKLEADLTSCKTAINLLIDRMQELGFIS